MPPKSGISGGKYAKLVQEALSDSQGQAASTADTAAVSASELGATTRDEVSRFNHRGADKIETSTRAASTAPPQEVAVRADASQASGEVPVTQQVEKAEDTQRVTAAEDAEDVLQWSEDDLDIEDEENGEEVDDAAGDAESSRDNAAAEQEEVDDDDDDNGPSQLFSCDVCPHLLFATKADLLTHAQAHHSGIFPDYAALHNISSKLAPVWSSLTARKRAAIHGWGEKIFHVAATRDAGAAKMEEAHRAREQLELVIRRWHAEARVFMFGSAVSFAVWDGMSDIDFAVVDVEALEAGTWPPPEKNAVRTTTELLRRAGFSFANIEPISHARVPIIKHHASAPMRLANRPVTWRRLARSSGQTPQPAVPQHSPLHVGGASQDEEQTVLEAEHVVARSVRFLLNQPATREDRVVLEGSVRHAVETVASSSSSPPPPSSANSPTTAPLAGSVQQVWWNRTADVMSVTCDSTTSAMRAATAVLSLVSPSLRAKVQPLHDECRPELFNVDFDLSFRAFGIRNSLLLRRYLTSHPCARPGAIVLKDWSKTSGVNNSVNGYLTSYAVNIMWIYFLVQRGVVPYVDPIRDIPSTLRAQPGVAQDPYLRDGFPAYMPFIPDDISASAEASGAAQTDLTALHAEAGELLLGFFHFYAFEFNWDQHVVSLNRKGITTKRMLGWDREDVAASVSGAGNGRRGYGVTRYAFCIEDPYEVNLNLGRHMGITKCLKVKSELYRALLSLLKDGEKESCVFAATDAAEARRRRSGGAGNSDPVSQATTPSVPNENKTDETTTLKSNDVVPDRLPLRVLFVLTATAVQTVAAHVTESAASAAKSVSSEVRQGMPSSRLQDVLRARHPAELALALKAWNWQQLVHRLGLKEVHGVIYPRREVGARRLATPAPPALILSTSTGALESRADATAPSESTSTPTQQAADTTASALRAIHTRRLGEQLVIALTTPGGYLSLRPEWVAWCTPWATLKTRFAEASTAAKSRKDVVSGKDGAEAVEVNRTTEAMASAPATAATAGLFASTRPHGMRPCGHRVHWTCLREVTALPPASVPTLLKRLLRK